MIHEVKCQSEVHRVLEHANGSIVLLDHSREEDRAVRVACWLGGCLHGCWAARARLVIDRRLSQRRSQRRSPFSWVHTRRWTEGVIQRARNLVPRELVDDLSLSELVAYRRAHPVQP